MESATQFSPQRTFHIGKYVLAYDILLQGLRGCRAPTQWLTIPELLARYPESATLQTVAPARVLPEFKYTYHGSEALYQCGVMPEQHLPPTHVLTIPHGRTFGRFGVVHVPAADCSLAEYDEGTVSLAILRNDLPGGRLNPRYWKHAAKWHWQRRMLPQAMTCPGKVAVLNCSSSHNFFHWLIEILPRLWTLQQSGAQPDWYVIDAYLPFQRKTLQALGVPLEKVIQPHVSLHVEADELLVPSLFFPNACREVGAQLAQQLNVVDDPRAPRRIFINRRKSRRTKNAAALAVLLRKFGFEEHFLEDYPLAKQIALFRQAEVVLAPHGAGLTHLIHCRPGTEVIELMPARRMQLCYPTLSRIGGLRHTVMSVPKSFLGHALDVPLAELETVLAAATNRRALPAAA